MLQQLQLLLQWAQQHDEAERALTDDNPFMDHRLTGDSPGERFPTGQPDLHAEQAHMPGLMIVQPNTGVQALLPGMPSKLACKN